MGQIVWEFSPFSNFPRFRAADVPPGDKSDQL